MKNRLTSRIGIYFALALTVVHLRANPNGGSVSGGSASITGQGTGVVTINQTTQNAIINWQNFSIGAGEATRFLQPNATSAVLNRVLGGQTSIIDGMLTANGRVYVVNENGILMGPNAQINTSAFVASTRNILDTDFLKGNLHFVGSSDAGVENHGTINALGGDVVLLGKTVQNRGTITAPNGTAALVAADDVFLAQKNADGSTVLVNPKRTAATAPGKVGVYNSGTITAAAAELKAASGNIYALAIQNEGTLRATTVQQQGGRIWLTADSGTVANTGTLDASASAAGGKGGTVILKSANGLASHSGSIIARGGQGGSGGDAEVSGAQLQLTGTVDLTAQNGLLGNLLIDPLTLEIITGGGSNPTASTLDPTALVTLLNGANVTLQATNSITVTNAVNASSNANAGNLTLDTVTLNLNAGITLKSGSVLAGTSLLTTVNVGSGGLVQNGIDAVTAGGQVNLASNSYLLSSQLSINKTLTLSGSGSTILNGQNATRVMQITGASGGINVTLQGLTLTGGSAASGGGLYIANGSGSANVTIKNSSIVSNRATNNSGSGVFGGGMAIDSANTVLLDGVSISSNNARFGSAIDNYGNLTILNSTIDRNTAASSGGIYINPGAVLTVSNSTITLNTSSGIGSGIDNDGGTVSVYNSTIVGNQGATGGGIYSSGTFTIGNSIIVGNTATTGPDIRIGGGSSTSLGYNIYGNVSGYTAAGTDINYTGSLAGLLQASGSTPILANNGGRTKTVALVAGSIAIDAGNPSLTGADQRGMVRGAAGYLTGSAPDIGAYELGITKVVANNQTMTYGGTLPTFTYQIVTGTSSLFSGSPGLTSTATNAGTYNGIIGLGTLNAGLYVIDITNGNLTIDKANLAVTANDQTKVYGAALPGLTVTYSGFVNGDTAASLAALPTTTTSALASSNVGTYGITASGAVSGNYNISYTGGTLSITPALLTVIADDKTKVYGAALPGLTVTYSGFVNGDSTASLTTLASATTSALASSNVGAYGITASGAIGGNYNISYTGGTLSITPALLTVTADDKTKVYGAALPGLSVTYSGFVNGDSTASLTTLASATTSALASSNAGTYGITASGAIGSNYNISYTSGTLSITPALLTVTADDKTKVYGAGLPGLTVTYSGFVNGDSTASLTTLASATTSALASSNVGTYGITASGAVSGNYNISYTGGTLSITPALLTVTADDKTKVYGAGLPGLTVTYSGFVNGDSTASLTTLASATTSALASSNVGTYGITASGAIAGNYTFSYVDGILDVTPATLAYVASPVTRYLGQTASLSGTVSGFVNGDTFASATTGILNFTSSATTLSPQGLYGIIGSGLTANLGNYVFVQDPANATALTINGLPTGPGSLYADFTSQFNNNSNYLTLFTQGQAPRTTLEFSRWLTTVAFRPNEPQTVYNNRPFTHQGSAQMPMRYIAFGSSYRTEPPNP